MIQSEEGRVFEEAGETPRICVAHPEELIWVFPIDGDIHGYPKNGGFLVEHPV